MFFKRVLGVNLNVNIAGDRYKANILDQRDTAINGGLSLLLPFITLRYEQDLSSTHNGNLVRAQLRLPLPLSQNFFLRTSFCVEFVSEEFSDYYYRVDYHEVGLFSYYNPGKERNLLFNLNATYTLTPSTALSLNWSHKRFGREIANSPPPFA